MPVVASNVQPANNTADGQPRLANPPVIPVRKENVHQVQAQPAIAPMSCFSAETKVYTENGEKSMKDLKVGDFVLVPASRNQLKYERVEMFYHREPETRAKFVVLETESGRKLILTELHLLPVGNCRQMRKNMEESDDVEQWLQKSTFAYKARAGDCVFSVSSNQELRVDRIVKVGRKYLKGIYSPMTVEGSIVTDGVLTSCFSQVESHVTQKLTYDFLIWLREIFGGVMQSLDEPVQHLPMFISSLHHLSPFVLPFSRY
ncbi:unnamed protein product [Thelazia callipaeda]|uniref:HintN domain-containing protein n=1 Tax=Thelazia callipaeda TaxID=103827 RepID=A0A0N5CLV4_THECL|nr:unnamed protein product [Thelazia callipaeda]